MYTIEIHFPLKIDSYMSSISLLKYNENLILEQTVKLSCQLSQGVHNVGMQQLV